MSGALQAVFQNQRSFALNIGDAYQGGFYAGQISTAGNGIADYNLVVGPLSTAQSSLQWKNSTSYPPGTASNIDGPANTSSMVADGSSTVYPCAHFCNNLSTGGQTDWYMPAKNELEICYFNLKPTTQVNNTSSGINPNAIPARASNYTSGNPAQTSAAAFQTGGAQAFNNDGYFSSTSFYAPPYQVRGQSFFGGAFTAYSLNSTYRVRAVRRVAV